MAALLAMLLDSLSAVRISMLVVAWVAGSARMATGQAVRSPTFVVEPGVITVNAVSAPLPTGSSTGLHLRFAAVIPTSIPWLSVELGTSFAPLGLSNGLDAFNEPTIFYGPIVMLLPRDRTSNWLEVTMPVLGSYRLDENGDAERLYVNDLVVQGVMTVPAGEKLMADMGSFWSRLTLYAIAEQNLTPSRNVTTRARDRFNPVFQYGVSIPIGKRAEPRREP